MHECAIGRQAILVIALKRLRVRHVRAGRRQLILARGAAIAFQQDHVIAMHVLHDLEDQQQTLREIVVEQLPVAAGAAQQRAQLRYFRRGKQQRRQGRWRHQLLALQQVADLVIDDVLLVGIAAQGDAVAGQPGQQRRHDDQHAACQAQPTMPPQQLPGARHARARVLLHALPLRAAAPLQPLCTPLHAPAQVDESVQHDGAAAGKQQQPAGKTGKQKIHQDQGDEHGALRDGNRRGRAIHCSAVSLDRRRPRPA
ncbi:hypothetical protein D3C81_797540 [compost metagenome]